MTERLEKFVDTRSPWRRNLGIGRRAVRLAQEAERIQRDQNIRDALDRPAWDFVDTKSYFFGELPVINTENPTPIVAALIEEAAIGNITRESVLTRRPRIVQPEWADQGHALVTGRLVHTREYGDHRVPGEFDSWYVGFVIHGSNETVLLQPHQVELTRAPAEEALAS